MGRTSGAQFWTLGHLSGDAKRLLGRGQGYRAEDRGQRMKYEHAQDLDDI